MTALILSVNHFYRKSGYRSDQKKTCRSHNKQRAKDVQQHEHVRSDEPTTAAVTLTASAYSSTWGYVPSGSQVQTLAVL